MNRRTFLSGLIAAPAIVAADSLMPIRGIVLPWIIPDEWKLVTQWPLPPHGPRPFTDSTAPPGTYKFVDVALANGPYRQYWVREIAHPEEAFVSRIYE